MYTSYTYVNIYIYYIRVSGYSRGLVGFLTPWICCFDHVGSYWIQWIILDSHILLFKSNILWVQYSQIMLYPMYSMYIYTHCSASLHPNSYTSSTLPWNHPSELQASRLGVGLCHWPSGGGSMAVRRYDICDITWLAISEHRWSYVIQ